jgi:hypothetical protein
MGDFKRFYIWGMNAKLYMGIYFAAIVFLSGALIAVFGGSSIPLLTLLQMLLVSFVIALVQVWVLPISTDLSKGVFFGRSIAWLLFSAALVATTARAFHWFALLPFWCPWLLGLLMFLGCLAMLVGLKFEQDADTVRLNDSLQKYKGNNSK